MSRECADAVVGVQISLFVCVFVCLFLSAHTYECLWFFYVYRCVHYLSVFLNDES